MAAHWEEGRRPRSASPVSSSLGEAECTGLLLALLRLGEATTGRPWTFLAVTGGSSGCQGRQEGKDLGALLRARDCLALNGFLWDSPEASVILSCPRCMGACLLLLCLRAPTPLWPRHPCPHTRPCPFLPGWCPQWSRLPCLVTGCCEYAASQGAWGHGGQSWLRVGLLSLCPPGLGALALEGPAAGLASGSRAAHCVILVPSFLLCGSLGPAPDSGWWVRPSNVDHSALLPRGIGLLSGLFVLKQSRVNKAPTGPVVRARRGLPARPGSLGLPPTGLPPTRLGFALQGLQLVSPLSAHGPRLLGPVLPRGPVHPRPRHPVARGGKSWC